MKKIMYLQVCIFLGLWGFMVYTIASKPIPVRADEPTWTLGEAFEVLSYSPEAPQQAQVVRNGTPDTVQVGPEDASLLTPGRTLVGHFFSSQGQLCVDRIWPSSPQDTERMQAFEQKCRKAHSAPGPIRIGARCPSFLLYNQDGQLVDEQDFLKKSVILGFFFSRCQAPQMCPLTLQRFLELQALLQKDSRPVHLILVTLDPEYDTPGLLSQFAAKQGFDPKHTSLLTGPAPWVQALKQSLGIASREEDSTLTHNLITALIDPQGILRHRLTTNTWEAKKVLELAESRASGGKGRVP